MEHTIRVVQLKKELGGQVILDGVNMEFRSGHTYGFMGRNGSGKTVFLKCICGFMPATEGIISLDGKILKKDMEYMEKMGFLIEHPGFLESCTAYDNLKYIASIRRIAGDKEIRESILRLGLDPDSRKKVKHYSLGMKQRLGVAQAIMENPDILILDEPMNGLDDAGVAFMRELLNELKGQGKIILIASHYKEDIEFLCDEIYNCKKGKFLLSEKES
ncbi:MAG: ATP-binding cassette domain-containing protein [Lachnospiraceae bacterium]|nr:ATP-binding cassette domain-containing protein [Lachnospiraceae bacterium]